MDDMPYSLTADILSVFVTTEILIPRWLTVGSGSSNTSNSLIFRSIS